MLGRVVLGRYEIVKYLDHGSMGQVWLARDRAEPRYAVVKQIRERVAGQPKYRDLFQREMQFMARFRHPHAVEFYDGSLDDEAGPCIVMEYVEGVGLDLVLKVHRFLRAEQLGGLLVQLCQALHAAHTTGIIHRDLKPANLMVVNPGAANEFLKVMDLGLAQLTAKPYLPLEKLQGSTDEYAVGTPSYICPEQLRGDPADHRGDIYSLGVVLFELLTGRLPFDQEDSLEVLKAHVKQRPPTFQEVGMALQPPAVERVVQQCLAKYPVERPQTAFDLACLFQAALGRPGDLQPLAFQPADVAPVPAFEAPSERGASGERIVEHFEAWMPEPIAVVKLRGFVQDNGGRVVESLPGVVRLILGEPPPPRSKPKSAILGWLMRPPEPPPAEPPSIPPVAIDLHMTKKEGRGQTRLEMRAVFRAVSGPLPDDPRWQLRVQELLGKLRAYLMAQP